jgi:hypothetical protein
MLVNLNLRQKELTMLETLKVKARTRIKASRTCVGCGDVFCAPPSSNKRSCIKPECRAIAAKMKGKRHGESGTRLHNIWCGMKSRGEGTKSKSVAKYYEHVSVCDEWKSYEEFRDWSLANGYRDDLEIDRIEVSGDYSPSNCRWANRTQQMQNTGVREVNNKTSRFKGVQYMKHLVLKPWRAVISINGKPKHLGCFASEVDAAKVYDAEAVKMYGEFANLNFKQEV